MKSLFFPLKKTYCYKLKSYKSSLSKKSFNEIKKTLSKLIMICLFVFYLSLKKSIQSLLFYLKKTIAATNHRVVNIIYKKSFLYLSSQKSLFIFSFSLIRSFKITIFFIEETVVIIKSVKLLFFSSKKNFKSVMSFMNIRKQKHFWITPKKVHFS